MNLRVDGHIVRVRKDGEGARVVIEVFGNDVPLLDLALSQHGAKSIGYALLDAAGVTGQDGEAHYVVTGDTASA